MSNFLQNQPKVDGAIAFFGLIDWWLTTFTPQEREYIETVYQPWVIGSEPNSNSRTLTSGQGTSYSGTATGLLSGVAAWFKKKEEYPIACKMLQKVEELETSNVLDLHFTYQVMIQIHYRMRNDYESAFDKAVGACEKQIQLAPRAAKVFKRDPNTSELPAHIGYQQLAIIREKQKDYDAVINLCLKAKMQGWDGDWDKRVERCQTKANKSIK